MDSNVLVYVSGARKTPFEDYNVALGAIVLFSLLPSLGGEVTLILLRPPAAASLSAASSDYRTAYSDYVVLYCFGWANFVFSFSTGSV